MPVVPDTLPLDYRAIIASESWDRLSSAATAGLIRLAAHFWASGYLPTTNSGMARKAGLSRESFRSFVWPQISQFFDKRETSNGETIHVYIPLEKARQKAIDRATTQSLKSQEAIAARNPDYKPPNPGDPNLSVHRFDGVRRASRRRAHSCWRLAGVFDVKPRRILYAVPGAPEDIDVESWQSHADRVGSATAWQDFCNNPISPPPSASVTA